MPIVINGVTLPSYADPADVPAALRAMSESLMPKAGGTFIGLVNMGGNRISGLGAPTSSDDATHKQYVDGKFGSIVWTTLPGKPTTFPPSTHGPHPTADMWTTARTLTLAGDLTGAVNIRGNANVTLTAAVVADSHTHDGRYFTEAQVNSLLAGHTHAYLPLTGGTVNGDTVFPKNVYIHHLEVDGQVVPSSVAYKTDIAPAEMTQSPFEKLDPISFRYSKDHPRLDSLDYPAVKRMGFSYEDVSEVAPQWAMDSNGVKGINLVAMLPEFMAWATAAIKELRSAYE